MPTPDELKDRFWKALKSDMTMMIGLDGIENGHARPMTAQLDGDAGPIWFFSAKDNALVQKIGQSDRAIATFTSKDMTCSPLCTAALASTPTGPSSIGSGTGTWPLGTRAGRTIPNWRFCGSIRRAPRFGSTPRSFIAGIKMLLGTDPKTDYKDKVARVEFR